MVGWKFGHIQLLNQQRSLEKEKECLIPWIMRTHEYQFFWISSQSIFLRVSWCFMRIKWVPDCDTIVAWRCLKCGGINLLSGFQKDFGAIESMYHQKLIFRDFALEHWRGGSFGFGTVTFLRPDGNLTIVGGLIRICMLRFHWINNFSARQLWSWRLVWVPQPALWQVAETLGGQRPEQNHLPMLDD